MLQPSFRNPLQQELLLSGTHYQTPSPRWLRYHPSEAICLLHHARRRHAPLPKYLSGDGNYYPDPDHTSSVSALLHQLGFEQYQYCGVGYCLIFVSIQYCAWASIFVCTGDKCMTSAEMIGRQHILLWWRTPGDWWFVMDGVFQFGSRLRSQFSRSLFNVQYICCWRTDIGGEQWSSCHWKAPILLTTTFCWLKSSRKLKIRFVTNLLCCIYFSRCSGV